MLMNICACVVDKRVVFHFQLSPPGQFSKNACNFFRPKLCFFGSCFLSSWLKTISSSFFVKERRGENCGDKRKVSKKRGGKSMDKKKQQVLRNSFSNFERGGLPPRPPEISNHWRNNLFLFSKKTSVYSNNLPLYPQPLRVLVFTFS